MGTKKAATGDKPSAVKNPKHRGKPPHLGPTKALSPPPYASDKLGFFVNEFESANGVRISSLELETIKDKSIVELSQDFVQDVSNLGKHIKTAFGSSWKEVLCEGMPVEGKIDPGNPSVLIIGLSALRSLELLRGVSSLTKQCSAVKLFSKHLKVEEQVSLLKNRVNIGSGTPSRIKKLIDIEALGLSRLEMVVLDLQTDLKGFSLFSLPQVRNEFWDLYKNYFHQRVLQGALRICLYGPIPAAQEEKKKKKQQQRKDREKRDADR
ncbi:PREDICTED: protein CMSS1 [Tarenaya hassleriana]|uniref:protein CMSS1 n=1 Tax=Tarenaya hassleriana TaxID=28532 RepID=UPI00053C204C|nr:PREDICTED: protein CMSS1 [Tarenaya hassleriana]